MGAGHRGDGLQRIRGGESIASSGGVGLFHGVSGNHEELRVRRCGGRNRGSPGRVVDKRVGRAGGSKGPGSTATACSERHLVGPAVGLVAHPVGVGLAGGKPTDLRLAVMGRIRHALSVCGEDGAGAVGIRDSGIGHDIDNRRTNEVLIPGNGDGRFVGARSEHDVVIATAVIAGGSHGGNHERGCHRHGCKQCCFTHDVWSLLNGKTLC